MKLANRIFTATLALVASGWLLCGCGEGSSQTSSASQAKCTHSYTNKVVAATCTQKGYTKHTCAKCGDEYTDSYVDALGHNFVEGERNYSCSRCSKSECDGFTLKLATYNKESCYVVTGVSSSALQGDVLETPRKYESLPVRGIMSRAYSSVTKNVKKIIIHDSIKNIYSDLWHGTSIYQPGLDTMSTLEEISFDSTCKDMRIESGAFSNCPKLAKANISKGMIRYIPADNTTTSNGGTGDYLFKGTPLFENISTVKNGVYYIADLLLYADFNEVPSQVAIDSGTIAMNNYVFYKNTVMTSVTIPVSVESIGNSAFGSCTKLATIKYSGTVAQFENISLGTSIFDGTKAKSIQCSDGTVSSYVANGYTYHVGG